MIEIKRKYKPAISKTYAELVAMIAGSSLVVGQKYKATIVNKYIQPITGKVKVGIYDYSTLTPEQLVEVQEEVLFTADAVNSLNPWAESLKYEGHGIRFDFTDTDCINSYHNYQGVFDPGIYYEEVGTIVKDANNDYYVLKVRYSALEPLSNTAVWKLVFNATDSVREGRILERFDTVNLVRLPFDFKQTKFAGFMPNYKQTGSDNTQLPTDIPEISGSQTAGTYYKYFTGEWTLWYCLRDNTDVAPAIPNFVPIHTAGYINSNFSSYGLMKDTRIRTFEILGLGHSWLMPDFDNYKEFYLVQEFDGSDESIVDKSGNARNVYVGKLDNYLYPYINANCSALKNINVPNGVSYVWVGYGGYNIEANDMNEVHIGGEFKRVHVNKNSFGHTFAFADFSRAILNRPGALYTSDVFDLFSSYFEFSNNILMGNGENISNIVLKGSFGGNIVNNIRDCEIASGFNNNRYWSTFKETETGPIHENNVFTKPVFRMKFGTSYSGNFGNEVGEMKDAAIGNNNQGNIYNGEFSVVEMCDGNTGNTYGIFKNQQILTPDTGITYPDMDGGVQIGPGSTNKNTQSLAVGISASNYREGGVSVGKNIGNYGKKSLVVGSWDSLLDMPTDKVSVFGPLMSSDVAAEIILDENGDPHVFSAAELNTYTGTKTFTLTLPTYTDPYYRGFASYFRYGYQIEFATVSPYAVVFSSYVVSLSGYDTITIKDNLPTMTGDFYIRVSAVPLQFFSTQTQISDANSLPFFSLYNLNPAFGLPLVGDYLEINGQYGDVKFHGESKLLNKVVNYKIKSANYTLTDEDVVVECDSLLTITLPTAVGITGREYNIIRSGSGNVTITPNGAETINGQSNLVLTEQYSSVVIYSNGVQWIRGS